MDSLPMKFFVHSIVITIAVCCSERSLGREDVSHEGKTISAWVSELRDKHSQAVRDQAKDAVQQAGTNALPFLLDELRTLGSLWQNDLTNFYNTPALVERQMGLRAAFEALGPVAKPAIPLLRERMNENGFVADTVQYALTQIDPAVAALILTEALTNSNYYVSCAAANNLYSLGPEAAIALPVLLKTLTDRSSQTNESRNLRTFSANALGAIGKQPEQTVPALATALRQDESPLVRLAAVRALEKFGTNAVPALPALREVSTDDPDLRVRATAAHALNSIELKTD
jgi:HEAT repeat protein